jgi:serine protease Do
VTVGAVTPALKQQLHLTPSSGALVTTIEPGSPAQSSSLRVNDVIVKLNQTAIESPVDLTTAIHGLKPGDHVTLALYRGSALLSLGVTLGARPTGG